MRRTKILATLGPATSTPEKVRELVEAGANIFRLNFSHGDHKGHQKMVEIIRGIEQKSGKLIGILADMQGPKLRIGQFEKGKIELQKGQTIRFDLDSAPGNETRVNLPHPEILEVLTEGNMVYLDDGNVHARITGKGADYVEAVIECGSVLSDRKGLNIPDAIIPLPALTEKDRIDLTAALEMGVDWIAQSFVQTPADVAEAKEIIAGRAALMAKIEKPSALDHLDEIIDLADGIMIARGDLGVEIPPEDVPAKQKHIIHQAREAGKPVVVATQMLESMIKNPRPTRAEASDVSTAVYDGTDAVMLSAETASGTYPVEAVKMMSRICCRTERSRDYEKIMDASHPETLSNSSDAITEAAYYVAQTIEAAFIVTYTASGSTALRMARQRPSVPILCLTSDFNVARQMSVSYGINAVHTSDFRQDDFTGPARYAAEIAVDKKIGQSGQKFVMTAGVPLGEPGSTNLMRIAEIG